jgi:hypothetical protein
LEDGYCDADSTLSIPKKSSNLGTAVNRFSAGLHRESRNAAERKAAMSDK